ncbi:MAG: type II toxin-antitoxin system HipA family toxin YjjJ [Deltaproteobacteria bacterium]|nr:type II toxin-antitoxin system HipA family toxin YjjJ [Deltaproteobacteria bacterium]
MLRSRGPSRFVDLGHALGGPNRSTFSRWIRSAPGEVVCFGKKRTGVYYAAPRDVVDLGSRWPLYAVSESGTPEEVGAIFAVEPKGFVFVAAQKQAAWMAGSGGNGAFTGLPFFLHDSTPQGFLGRALARRLQAALGVPARLADWQEHHVLTALTKTGADNPGNWLVGKSAHDLLMRERMAAPEPPRIDDGGLVYERLAGESLADQPPGSSAGGEQPKFATLVRAASSRHVLVKSSPARGTAVGDRWADLLVAEHLAHGVLQAAGLPAAKSRVLDGPTRRFLEVERFDRVGLHGRRATCSLFAIDVEYFGALDSWPDAGARLLRRGWLEADDVAALGFWWDFSGFIGNTDRHFGNATLFFDQGRMKLAPAYDMLPMLFAPQGGEIVARPYVPPLPIPGQVEGWRRAGSAARSFWALVANDRRVSREFRATAAQCDRVIQEALRKVG